MQPAIHAALIEEDRKRQHEEDHMTRYTAEELQQDYEFKIVRANDGRFRHADVLQALLDEEAAAGWQLLEKLDDNRVRFKRPRSAARRDDLLATGIDPYRTQVGSSLSSASQRYLILGVFMAALVVAGIILFFMMSNLSQ